MIERGIIALMIIFSINGVLIVSGVAGNFNDPQTSLNLLPTGLNPSEIDSSAIDINLEDSGIEAPETNLFTFIITSGVDFILSLPLIGDAINVFFTLGGTFLKFLFYWTIVLDISGLPAGIIFIIKIPLVVFQFGILFFGLLSIIGAFTGSFK